MKDALHATLIGTIRKHVIVWRKSMGWSRETVVQVIIEAHEKIGASTGIVFDPQTSDLCERREVNAQRVFRWLDDESKETNLLPANFIPSIWAAMPVESRMACVSEILVPLGLGVRLLDDANEGPLDINDVIESHLATCDAHKAATIAAQNPTPENLEAADLQMTKAEKRHAWLRKKIASAKNAVTVGKALVGKLVHRKDKASA